MSATITDPRWSKYLRSVYLRPKNPASFQNSQKIKSTIQDEGIYPELETDTLQRWLETQLPYSRHKVFRARAIRRPPVKAQGPYDQFDADLADMQKLKRYNKGMSYLLVVIDVFTRRLWVQPIRKKTNVEVVQAFKKVFSRIGYTPRRLRTDAGKEFVGKQVQQYFSDHNITHFIALNELKANYAERVIKTIKTKIVRYLTSTNNNKYVDILQDLVTSYNNTYHKSIGMSPAQVTDSNQSALWWKQYQPKKDFKKSKNPPKFKFEIGDTVHIPKLAGKFAREYDVRWTDEVFTVVERFRRDRLINMYTLEDENKEPILGTFYEMELQRAFPHGEWEIESVLKERGGKVFVKFKGWPSSYNRWISRNHVQTD